MKKLEVTSDNSAPKQPISIPLRSDNDAHPFIRLGRDVHSHIIGLLPIKDASSLLRSCTNLWVKNQGALFRLFLRDTRSELNNDAFAFLPYVIDLDENFCKFRLNLQHLTHVLNTALPVLTSVIKSDLRAAPKFAAICGNQGAVEAMLGDRCDDPIDHGNHCVASYYSLGGQLACLKDFRKRWPKVFRDQMDAIARQAALGGHIHILQYLKDECGYDLKTVFRKVNAGFDETLLSSAAKGGHKETIDFLIKEGVSTTIGINLAVIASQFGHWGLYQYLSEEVENPFSGYLDQEVIDDHAAVIASNALRTGKLELGLSLIKQFRLDPKKLFEYVIEGGHSNVFWHFINNDLVLLTDRFENDATIEHLLAQYGQLSLLKEVLADPRPKNGVFAVDAQKKSIFHYAAKGSFYDVYSFAFKFFKNQPCPLDELGETPAHTAAKSGSVWFIKLLMRTESGRKMLQSQRDDGETVLHAAVDHKDIDLLCLLIDEAGIEINSVDKAGSMVVHKLASKAISEVAYWRLINNFLKRYGNHFLDVKMGKSTATLRFMISAFKAEKYFDASVLKPQAEKQLGNN